MPIFHEDLVDARVKPRIDQDGVWGFTGKASPPPSPSTLPQCLPALAEWGITLENMITSQKGTEEEEALIRKAGEKVHEYVKERWNEDTWETAWFVNPPVSVRRFTISPLHHFLTVTFGYLAATKRSRLGAYSCLRSSLDVDRRLQESF